MIWTEYLLPVGVGGLIVAALYSSVAIATQRRFGGAGLGLLTAATVLGLVGYIAPQASRAEHDHPVLAVIVATVTVALLFTPTPLAIWRSTRAGSASFGRRLAFGVGAFYGGLVLALVFALAIGLAGRLGP